MKEEIVQLSDHLKGLSDGERAILWQAMTIDILSHLVRRDDDTICLLFGKFDDGLFHAVVRRQSREGNVGDELMIFAGEPTAVQ